MKKLLLLACLIVNSALIAQSLINVYEFPRYNPYNFFWGITSIDSSLWIATDFDGTGYPLSMMYRVTKTGAILDSVVSPFKFNHGLSWDGANFWWAEDYRSSGARIYKINSAGIKLDSITLPNLIGGASGGIGDIEVVGNSIWFSIYYPDFASYPNAYAYRMDLNTHAILDTVPLYGRQPQGITVKGDTIFYVNDNFQDAERIYAYRKSVGDTIFSIPVPDPDNDCSPRGLFWDGDYLWLIADRVGTSASTYRALYKYDVKGSGTPVIFTQPSLAFGDVTIGLPLNLNLNINNNGTADLSIDSIRISSSLFTYSPANTPHYISPGQFQTYQITFNPVDFGDQFSNFTIYSNAPVTPVKTVQLSGRGVYGNTHIAFSSEQLDFGGKRKHSTSSLSLKIFNRGTQTLTIDSLIVGTQYFNLKDYNPPINLPYTDSTTIRVWFNPTDWLNYSDTIKIYSNAVNGSIKKIALAGFTISYDSTLGGIIWQGTTPDNPSTSFDDYTARYVKRIRDINNDGIDDIIVTTDNYLTVAYNGNSSGSADILWTFNTAPDNNNTGNVDYNQGLQIIDDITGDGINDVVIGTAGGGESVIAINGVTGQLIWEYGDPINYNNGDVWAVDVKRDWNGDGKKDVLASVSGNETTGQGRFSVYLLDGTNGNILWQINQASEWKLKYAIASTDDGGAVGSRVAGANPGQVIGFNKLGNIIWTYNATASPWGLVEISDIGGTSNSDLIVGGFDGKVYALSGDSGKVIWQTTIGNAIIEDLFLSPDVDADGVPDIWISALVPNAFMISGKNGNILWSGYTGGNNLGAGVLGDLTGDFIPEMGVGSLANVMKIFNGLNGQEVFSYVFGPGTNTYSPECVWQMDDLDRNGSLEFAVGTRDGRVFAFSGGLSGTVPVDMSAFTASVDGNTVHLIWSTATELNNKGFSVERLVYNSQSSVNIWEKVGFVSGNGTSSQASHYSFVDKKVGHGTHFYRLAQIDFDGTVTYSREIEVNVELPIKFALEQNYPNPFNPSTIISWQMPVRSQVTLRLYDMLGREVKTLVNEIKEAGFYKYELNASTLTSGVSTKGGYASGVYFYRLTAGNFTSTKKMILLR